MPEADQSQCGVARMQWTAERRWQVLREVEEGASVKEVSRRYGISRQTYYNWKKRFE